MPDKYTDRPSVIVVGGGPAGLTAAITLASAGLATVLVGKRPARPDHRTTALFAGSVTALETLGVWPLCAAQASPLKTMRIVDDTGRLWRAPEVKFDADEIDLDAFGYNIENFHLVAALEQRAGALPSLRLIED
jgi:2-octaprenyl-6-methoxyphenol hydroxylase